MSKKKRDSQTNKVVFFGGIGGAIGFLGGLFFLEAHSANFDGLVGIGWGFFLAFLGTVCGTISGVGYFIFYVKFIKSRDDDEKM